LNIGIFFLPNTSISTLQKNLTSLPIVHELLKHQPQYHHRVLTAYKISGYPSSSGKKKPIDVLINIRILKFVQISVCGTPNLEFWVGRINLNILLIYPMKSCFTFNLLDKKI
jgi:hypothetical protein